MKIEHKTLIDGTNVNDLNDLAIFNRIAQIKEEKEQLEKLEIAGPAMEAAIDVLLDQVAELTDIVNFRHED